MPITCPDPFGRLDLVGRHVDDADQNVLVVEQREQAHRHARIEAFDRDLADLARGERRKDRLVLPPFAAERSLPVDIRLNAVAVADVHRGGAVEPVDGTVQRLDAPSGTSSMNTLKAGSSNWMTSTPSLSSARASSLRRSAKAIAILTLSP